jgi:glucokinase
MPDLIARDRVVALDIGGTAMKGGVLGSDLRMGFAQTRSTPINPGPQAVTEEMIWFPLHLEATAVARGMHVRGAGVAVPGVVPEDKGTALYSANLGWRDLDLAALLSSCTGRPVAPAHDVRAGAEAESVLGAARGLDDVLFVTIGTGIASEVVGDGSVARCGGFVGELGHLPVEPRGRSCPCGGRGCLETIASARAIAATCTRRTGQFADGALDVVDATATGYGDALVVWYRAARALASARCATAVTLLGSQTVVPGGGLAQSGDLLLCPVRRYPLAQLTFQRVPALLRAAPGAQAGSTGAGLRARRAVSNVHGVAMPEPEIRWKVHYR